MDILKTRGHRKIAFHKIGEVSYLSVKANNKILSSDVKWRNYSLNIQQLIIKNLLYDVDLSSYISTEESKAKRLNPNYEL